MTNRRLSIALLTCIALLIFGICLCGAGIIGAGIGGIAYWSWEPPNLDISYAMPTVVQRGDPFDLVITMTNTGCDDLLVEKIDLDKSLTTSIFGGAYLESTDPALDIVYGSFWMELFQYQRAIPPGESREVVFHLFAFAPGDYQSELRVFAGNHTKNGGFIQLTVLDY